MSDCGDRSLLSDLTEIQWGFIRNWCTQLSRWWRLSLRPSFLECVVVELYRSMAHEVVAWRLAPILADTSHRTRMTSETDGLGRVAAKNY